jgi:hypothetical protein
MEISWVMLLVPVVGFLILLGIGVAVFLLLTGKKDQRPGDGDERR